MQKQEVYGSNWILLLSAAGSLVCVIIFLFLCMPVSKPDKKLVIKSFDELPKAEVLILGTYHFATEKETDELSRESQKEIEKLILQLSTFQPTKIFIEKEPIQSTKYNNRYRDYHKGKFDIHNRPNEIYQLGFRLAKHLDHDSIFLFDNQTEFIGSLENFSFSSFFQYADSSDSGFYDKHLAKLKQVWTHNDSVLKSMPLFERIKLINSERVCSFDAERMHMLEFRVGIGENWVGADWVARFYQRNLRMMGNVLKSTSPEDRVLIIVGSNHKWILDQIFGNSPDFEVVDVSVHL